MLQNVSEVLQLLNVLLIPMAIGAMKMHGRISSLEASVSLLIQQQYQKGACPA